MLAPVYLQRRKKFSVVLIRVMGESVKLKRMREYQVPMYKTRNRATGVVGIMRGDYIQETIPRRVER